MELDKIKLNPNNPRFIKDDNFKKLVKSLIELPVMTELREIVVDEDNVIIGGNMRYRAAKEAGWKEIPTKVFTRAMADENNKLTNQTKTYEEYCKEIMIKDNISGGEWDWDKLSSEFEKEELEDWGLDVDKWGDNFDEDFTLPDGDKAPFQQITFTLADKQAELINEAIDIAKKSTDETFGNENSNGNALYLIIKQWMSNK